METIERLKLIEKEMKKCFDEWDDKIRNGQQPVPIQDLNFWQKELDEIIEDEIKLQIDKTTRISSIFLKIELTGLILMASGFVGAVLVGFHNDFWFPFFMRFSTFSMIVSGISLIIDSLWSIWRQERWNKTNS